MWYNAGWKVGHFSKEVIVKALFLISAVLTTACIGPKTEVSFYFDHGDITRAEQYCKPHGGLKHLELRFGDKPNYQTHCNQTAPVAVNHFSCESCQAAKASRSYELTADKVAAAREVCLKGGKMLWVQFQLRSKDFTSICRDGATYRL